MTSADPTTAAPDLQFADAIARAEQRRAVLERLVEIGMVLAEEVGARKVDAPPRAEPRHDPCRSFAAVSRAVRLSLAFASRIDAEIIAMRNSEVKPPNRPAAPKRAPDKAEVASFSPRALGPEGIRVRDAVWSAIDARFGDFDGAMGALDELHERLIDYETLDRIASRPWRETVEAICADLGLEPDWSRWSDGTGFIGPVGKPNVKWNMLWSYDPKRAEHRRRRRAEGPASTQPMTEVHGPAPP